MARFLIEVPHEPGVVACAKVIQVFLGTGSHFLSNADWGCADGEHKAWIIIDVDKKEDALALVPPGFRSQAKVIRLSKFTIDEVAEVIRQHEE